ncbi:MAG: hypothetical protein QXN55_01090 [Candidatus Nitrosotenuis sp.]
MKETIQQELLTKTGKINARKVVFIETTKSRLYQRILDTTSFLPEQTHLNERLFCILNDIFELPKCPICMAKKSYALYRGYKDTCGKTSCAVKFRYLNANERRKTGISTTRIISQNKKSLIDLVNSQETFLSYDENTDFSFKSVTNIKRIAAIIKLSETFLTITEHTIEDFERTFKLRKFICANKELPTCKICNKKHTRLDSRNYPAETCSKECDIEKSVRKNLDSRLEKLKDEIRHQAFEIIEMSSLITKSPVKLLCSNGHEFERWLQGGRKKQIVCPICNPIGLFAENEIVEFLKELLPTYEIVQHNKTIITPYELDIVIPALKLAIEFNGLYRHSYDELESSFEKNYHLMKLKMANEKGFSLIHIFENEWLFQREIVKRRLIAKLGINKTMFARKCKVHQISNSESKNFLEEHHIQSSCPSSINLGLFFEDSLCGVMTFGKSRFNKNIEFELLRYASANNIIGGGSKLFKEFLRIANPNSVISYSDRRWNNGIFYEKLGFKWQHNSAPNYFWIDSKLNLHSRLSFQKHKLKEKLEKFDESLSEAENMFQNGFRRIWDCGNSVWIWQK